LSKADVTPLLRSRLGIPHGGPPRLDLADLYAFPKPGDAGKSILVMNVHPSAYDYLDREKPRGPTTIEAFAPEALYEIKIDTNGDAVADIAYRMRFSSSAGGVQTATLRRVEGAQAAGANESGQAIVEGAPASTGLEARVTDAGDYRSFLSILTNGKVTRDKVGPHGDFLAGFPYLGPPHNG
jgi:hypothetical protein